MPGFDNIIDVQIAIQSPPVSASTFGIPAVVPTAGSLGVGFTERVRFYDRGSESLADDLAAGDITSDVAEAVNLIYSQLLSVSRVAVLRVDSDVAQSVTYTFTGTPASGDKLIITVNGIEVELSADSTDLGDEVGDLRTLMGVDLSDEPVTIGGSAGVITITADPAGTPFTSSAEVILAGAGTLEVAETAATANRSISTELDLVRAENDDWFAICPATRTRLQLERIAEWVESKRKLLIAQTADADVLTSVNTDLASALKAKNYSNTLVLYHYDSEFANAALAGFYFEADPGVRATTVFGKTLVGVTPQTQLSDTEMVNLQSKNANVYSTLKKRGVVGMGKVASGEWFDVIVTKHWLQARIEERWADLQIREANANRRVPYDDTGIEMAANEIRAQLADAVIAGHVVAGSEVVEPPAFASVSDADKAARRIRIPWSAQISGAIHSGIVRGYLQL